jgi:hypothetical protein
MEKDHEIWYLDCKKSVQGGAIKSVVGELEKYEFDLVGVQDFKWEWEGYQTAENYIFFYGKREC